MELMLDHRVGEQRKVLNYKYAEGPFGLEVTLFHATCLELKSPVIIVRPLTERTSLKNDLA